MFATPLTIPQQSRQRKSTSSSSQITHPTSLTRSSTTPVLMCLSMTRKLLGGQASLESRKSPRTRISSRSFGLRCSSAILVRCVTPSLTARARITSFFGDLKDGTHDGSLDDPRVSLIEVVPSEIRYWVSSSSAVGRTAEIAYGALTGEARAPGESRTISDAEVRHC